MSLAVRVLQKNSVGCLFSFRPISEASNASLSYCTHLDNLAKISFKVLNFKPRQHKDTEDSDLIHRLKSHLCIDFIGFGISLIQNFTKVMISSSSSSPLSLILIHKLEAKEAYM